MDHRNDRAARTATPTSAPAGRALLGLVVLAAAAACTPPGPEPAIGEEAPRTPPTLDYRVQVDPASPRRLSARLDLSRETGAGRIAFVRGLQFGLASQVDAPACDGVPLVAAGDGQWRVPDRCAALTWSILVEDARPGGADASLQRSLYFPDAGWWLLSEPTSLLRLAETADAPSLALRVEGVSGPDAIAGATPVGEGRWRLPPVGSAPEFFAFGALSLQRHDLGRLHATYVIDDPARFERLPLLDMHRQALGYLAEVYQVPPALPAEDRHLLVMWLGIDASLGEAGGAAGSRSFLANYIVGEDGDADLDAARTMLVLAHEQSHQLHDLMWRGGPPVPTWLGESLAHYHGLMALARSGLSPDVIARPMDAFIDADRPVEVGLVEYQRRYDAGDQEAYGQFYVQGATFWSEADRILRAASPEQAGLEALMPAMLAIRDADGIGLPASLRRLLVERGGPEMERLIQRYVGD